MGTNIDPTPGVLHVPQLIAALCYHLALQDCDNIGSYNLFERSKSRDGLYRAYKDVAFSQLFGLDQPQEQRLQSSWTGVPRACSLKDRVDVAQGVKSVGNARLAILKERLVEGHVHGPHGVDWKDDGNESKQQWSRFDLLVPEGFEGTQIEQYESFVLSEGANVFKFLEYLKDSAQSDDMDPSEMECYEDALQKDYRELNMGLFVNETPDFFPIPLSNDFSGSQTGDTPAPQGWFLEDTKGCIDSSTTKRESSQRIPEPMVYQPSNSPVKVSLGSLFLDKSPGKMTFFEKTHSQLGAQNEKRANASGKNIQMQHGEIPHHQISKMQLKTIQVKRIWGGEEAEIAREALQALSGIRASLSKLRGRLIMPQALPRPTIAPILSDIEKASSSRASIESYIYAVSREIPQDLVSIALAGSLKEILNDVDKNLVALEVEQSKNWVQPLGITRDTNSMHQEIVLDSMYRPDEQTRHFESDSCGAEYHGAGVSILSLAHATAEIQSMLLFLSSFLDLETLRHKSVCEYPKCRALLESLYSKAPLEGDQGRVAKRLVLGALAPYVSVVRNWAFGIENLDEGHCFVGLLGKQYSMRLPGRAKDISGRWISGLGPSDIPSFFSEECKKSLLVAGTQLRLLYSVSRTADGETTCSPRACDGSKSKPDEPWFMYSDGSTMMPSGDMQNAEETCSSMSDREAKTAPKSKQEVGISCLHSLKSRDLVYLEPTVLPDDSLSGDIPLSFHLETLLGSVLKNQACIVSQACLNLFLNDLDTTGLIEYMRNVFMGFAGDFQSEFLRVLEPSVSSLEPLTLHKVRLAMIMASSNSCLHENKYAEQLIVSLLPAENAISLVEEAFKSKTEFSDVSRIKSPFHSAMQPILVPPTGVHAFDCINVSLDPSWPMAALLSDDILTAYSAILSMNLRLTRAKYALETLRTLCCGRNVMKQLLSFELVPWIQNLKSLCSFCFRAARHLDAISQFYASNCCGEHWTVLQSTLTCPIDGNLTIHDLIKTHREYIYESSGRILTCCSNSNIKNTIQRMLGSILDLKGTLTAKIRKAGDVRSVLADPCSWQDLEREIKQYDLLIATLRGTHSSYEQAITESERNVKIFLQSFL
jgi:hypothetical protein